MIAGQNVVELNRGAEAPPFCVRFNEAVTRHTATLDTGPRARSYPGGGRTHLSMKHFQFAAEPHVRWCRGWAGQFVRLPDFADQSAGISGCR